MGFWGKSRIGCQAMRKGSRFERRQRLADGHFTKSQERRSPEMSIIATDRYIELISMILTFSLGNFYQENIYLLG